jgi:hypothetical protein
MDLCYFPHYTTTYGRARDMPMVMEYIFDFRDSLAWNLIVPTVSPSRPKFDVWYIEDARMNLEQLRQVPVGSGLRGIKIKGDIPVPREAYLRGLICGPDALVQYIVSAFNKNADNNAAAPHDPDDPDDIPFIRVPPDLIPGLTRLLVQIVTDCVDLMLATPAPGRINVRPLFKKFREGYLRLSGGEGRRPGSKARRASTAALGRIAGERA